MKIDQFTKSSSPITVIVNITNPVAIKLSRILLEQGSKILIVDKLNHSRKKLLNDLLQNKNCLFMDSESTFRNIDKFKKIDYVYYFLSHIISGSTYPNLFAENMDIKSLSHKDFIRESNRIDAYLKLALEFRATATLVTSAYLGQFLESLPELNVQIQKYAESLVQEYVKKNKLDARVIRIGELIGEGGDPASPTNLSRLMREIVLREKVNIFGDGLQQNYLVHVEDAVYALLKATFTKKAAGETYMAAYKHPFTSLSLAYQLLELSTEEKQVIFNEVLPDYEDILKLNELCLTKSVETIGWEPQIPLEQALSESLSEFADAINFPWKAIENPAALAVSKESGSTSVDIDPEDTTDNLTVKRKPKKKVVTSGTSGFLYGLYHRLIAEPVMWVTSLPKKISFGVSENTENIKTKSKQSILGIIIAIIAILILAPYVDLVVTGIKLGRMAKHFEQDIAVLDTSNFDDYAIKFPLYAATLVDDYESISYWQYVPRIGDTYIEVGKILQGYSLYAKSSAVALKASSPALEIIQGIATITPNSPSGQTSRSYFSEIEEIMGYRNEMVQATQESQVAKLRLDRVDKTALPSYIRAPFESSLDLLNNYTISLTQLENFYDLIPYLLGYKERRTYFLMVQNETEIRATGGWFTNYAILGIENGQVRELTVEDIYNTEGQIDGLPASKDMKVGLDIDTYKIGLANWDPELKNVSDDIETLMAQKGTYKPNDVTITLNFSVISKLLSVLGPIDAGDLGEVTSQNLFDKIGQLHSDFVPGSQDKVSTVSDFMPNLMNAIATAPIQQKQQVITVLVNAVEEKEIMIYSSDPLFRTSVLDEFDTYRTINPEDNPLFVVDWNWGGNKANRFVTRSTDITIDETDFSAEMVVSYSNTSTAEEYPMGTFKNIQRIYYPTQFSLNSYEGYLGEPTVFQSKYKNVPYLLGKFEVGIRSASAVTLNFKIKEMPASLFIPKQSGISSENLNIAIVQSDASNISEQKLREQGFTKVGNKWNNSYSREEDVTIKLR